MKSFHYIYLALLATAAGTALCNQGVLILSATKLGLDDNVTSTFGSFLYTGFLLLPLSFSFTRRFGVHRGLGGSLLLMSVCMLGLGLVIFVPPAPWKPLVFLPLLFLSQSMTCVTNGLYFLLQRTIPPGEELNCFISRRSYLTQGGTLAFSLLTVWYLAHHQATRQLSLLYWGSFLLFLVAAACYLRLGDIPRIRDMLSRPLWQSLHEAVRFPAMRRLLPIGIVQNLALLTLTPNSILALKGARQATDNQIVFLTSLELVSAIISAYVYKQVVAAWGPRKCMLLAYNAIPAVALFWWFVPMEAPLAAFAFPFIISGILLIFCSMAMANYFTVVMPDNLQMSGTLLIMLVHGVLAGLLGIALNSLLHQVLDIWQFATPWTHYRLFFSVLVVLYVGCLVFGRRMTRENVAQN